MSFCTFINWDGRQNQSTQKMAAQAMHQAAGQDILYIHTFISFIYIYICVSHWYSLVSLIFVFQVTAENCVQLNNLSHCIIKYTRPYCAWFCNDSSIFSILFYIIVLFSMIKLRTPGLFNSQVSSIGIKESGVSCRAWR